jgi:mycofactocin precursor
MPEPVIEHPVPSPARAETVAADRTPDQPLVEADLLVEDVSIDGMCGVY